MFRCNSNEIGPDVLRSFFKDVVTEKMITELIASYESDNEPFLTKKVLNYQPRSVFIELDILRVVFFPRYFNKSENACSYNQKLLEDTILELALVFFNSVSSEIENESQTLEVVKGVIEQIPKIRELLKTDVVAAYEGDPAANSITEVVRCYPSVCVMTIQRVAHLFYALNAKMYARELCELAHQHVSIDIHPGAVIGHHFFIDHGDGTVIGETAVIGNWVRIYQSVTLGALHFKQTDGHSLLKGYRRHPTIGDDVVIGAGAKLLGPINVGSNVSIGANSWVQEDIADHMAVFITEHPVQLKKPKKVKEKEKETENGNIYCEVKVSVSPSPIDVLRKEFDKKKTDTKERMVSEEDAKSIFQLTETPELMEQSNADGRVFISLSCGDTKCESCPNNEDCEYYEKK